MSTRRKFLIGCGAALIGGLGGIGYARYLEPGWFELCRKQVSFFKGEKNGNPLRVLFLSDLHYSRCVSLEMISRAINLGLAEKPDLILLGGDHVLFDMPLDDAAFSATLSPLAKQAPTVACFGNHDLRVGTRENARVKAMLTAAGIEVLCNQCKEMTLGGKTFSLVVLGDLWNGQCLPKEAFKSARKELPCMVLSHNPDSKGLLEAYSWELMLCGHTHGGQLYIPFIGTPFAPVKDQRYVSGLNAWQGRKIYTTRGVGNLHGVRINCRPEVTLLELV